MNRGQLWGISIQRLKFEAKLNAEQFWDTTINPHSFVAFINNINKRKGAMSGDTTLDLHNQILLHIEIEDVNDVDDTFLVLMDKCGGSIL